MTMGLTGEATTVDSLMTSLPGVQELAEALKLLASNGGSEPPLHFGYDEAARRLNIPEHWLRDRISSLPHRKMGRTVQFTDGDLKAISEMHFVRPSLPVGEESEASTGSLRPSKRSRRRL